MIHVPVMGSLRWLIISAVTVLALSACGSASPGNSAGEQIPATQPTAQASQSGAEQTPAGGSPATATTALAQIPADAPVQSEGTAPRTRDAAADSPPATPQAGIAKPDEKAPKSTAAEAPTATATPPDLAATDTPTEEPPPADNLAHPFALPSALDGKPVSLESYRGQKNVVLVFYRGFW